MMLPRPRLSHRVTGWGGVSLHVPEWGNPDGQPIILIHGWSQAHQSWARQLDGALDAFRIIIPDLRGHGMSDKPQAPEHYNNGTPWAEDVKAILDALALNRPILVGWSMGGWVVQDYLTRFGDSDIGGFVLVGSSARIGSFNAPEAIAARAGDTAVAAAGMYSDDLSENLEATRAFLGACFHQAPDAEDLALMMGFNMVCPVPVRDAARNRNEDYRAVLSATHVPGLVLCGAHERMAVDPMPQDTVAAIPNGRSLTYENSGHSPFWEEPNRFNTDLTTFAKEAATL